ncbi:MAG: type I-C CRISPR-associated protein Cas8c/Csd1, partial [Planctomycetia bacterium]|nr:type I-C CRISPR-associated protein Cas8c/Csd1 [Planctomycetia bacterium]
VSLIAYNKDAFQSHSLEDSLNAPMCQRCVDAYSVAFDRLLRPSAAAPAGPSFGGAREVAGVAFCYWCRDPLKQDPMLLPFEAPVKDVDNLLQAVDRGDDVAAASKLEETFFVLPVSAPSKGRAVVHGWITTTLSQVRQNLADWFKATEIVDPFTGEKADPVRLADPPRDADNVERARIYNRHIPSALSRWNREKRQWEIPSSLVSAIVRCAIEGPLKAPLPLEILSAALTRLRADVHKRSGGRMPGFTTARIGLMRAILNQHPELRKGEPIMPGLDRTRDDAAYVCGRLLAVLTRAQAAALRGDGDEQRISASVVSRYYSSASARPATGLYVPTKMRIAHLNKLDRDAPGLAIRFRKELEEIFGLLGGPTDLPPTLTPAEQCIFAIGFEHQMAELWKAKTKGNDGSSPSDTDSGDSK